MNLSEYFDRDLVNYAAYDNVRKIASILDGLKNSSRKVVYTVNRKNITHSKVQNVSATVSLDTQYLHGSLDGVVVSLCKTYPGTNQLPLLRGFGNFGSRDNHEASASRYISCGKFEYLDKIFLKDELVEPQDFEGDKIEPKFLLPVLPMLLINGSNGLSTGYKQTILPRKLSDVIKVTILAIRHRSNAALIDDLLPFIKGFNGTIEKDEGYIIKGVYDIEGNKITITELPYDIENLKYINKLDSLVENGDIVSYEDKSTDENICFIVKAKKIDDKLIKKLGLETKVSETLTAIDENNHVQVFDKLSQILTHYIDYRLVFVEKRRLKIIEELKIDIEKTKSIIKFIEANLDLRRKSFDEVTTLLDKLKLFKDITSDPYAYIRKLTVGDLSKYDKYAETLALMESELNHLENLSPEDMWIQEIKNAVQAIKDTQ